MNIVKVAVAVIFDKEGKVLISQRASGAHQGGKWEFPGGKIEPDETVVAALNRELFEELGIRSINSSPFFQIKYHYSDKSVLLDVWRVYKFEGLAQGKEGQQIRWCKPEELSSHDFPAANKSIITALCLPDYCLISPSLAEHSLDFFELLGRSLLAGMRLIQLRDKSMTKHEYTQHAHKVLTLCSQYHAKLILNADPELLNVIPAHGIHLNSQRLFQFQSRPIDEDLLLSASCHNEVELRQAEQLEADFIFISPVCDTASHLGKKAMGWERFSELAMTANRPVYALGGMKKTDLQNAKLMGARGVAGIRNFFTSR